MRGSFGSTPGREPSTDCKKLASCRTDDRSGAAAAAVVVGAAAASAACDMDMASASCIASSSSSPASVMSTSVLGTTGVVSVAAAGGRAWGGAPGVTAGGFAAGVTIAADASPPTGIDMARAASRSAASSTSPPPPSVSMGAAPAPPSALLGAALASAAVDSLLPGAAAAPSAPASPVADLAASASCRARSSSIEMRSAYANSGSMFGSTPNSAKPSPPPPPVAAAAAAAAPSSPWMIEDERRMSERTCGPGGTVTRWLLSSELTAFLSASSFAAFSASSPKLMMSIATEFFLSFLPNFTKVGSSSFTGLPTNTMIRCRWFLFCRCLSESCATWMPAVRLASPPILIPWDSERIFPTSVVRATCTSMPFPAVESSPTVFSGLDCVFAPDRRLTASSWASIRLGAKSPLRM
mmetsp:Transcript_10508/g.22861  ORF Transcript_10508/g.22861 Transcript_10508/m.22861 type:complete len:410 (+) Transcript_10508:413-1642(+)